MMNICNNRINTTKEWNKVNPVLLFSELGIEITENNKTKIKIGNGKDTWKDLEYISIDYDKSLVKWFEEIPRKNDISDMIKIRCKSIKNSQSEIEDELKFTQLSMIAVIIMNIILVSALLCILFA